MAVAISALTNRNVVLSTIQPCTLCNRFELVKEMTLGFPIFICENPARRPRMLLVIGQQGTQLSGKRDMAFLVVLRKEAHIRLSFAAHRKSEAFQVEIFPSGEPDLLFATSGADKKEMPQIFLGRHRREEFGEFVGVIRFRPGPLNLRKLGPLRRFFDTVRLKERKNKTIRMVMVLLLQACSRRNST
jgi:hypothetical protein